VAVLGHRRDSRARVAAAITPSVALALETQVLLDQAQHLVDDVNRSRADAARSTDAARRALERDLHDGAQQRLLVAGMTLGEAADRAADGGERYRAAAADLAEALHELRRIGRGDAAAVAELGLADAATALAGRSPVAVASVVGQCGAASHECWPVGTATAAYRLLVQTVSAAASSGGSGVEFAARCLGPGRGREVEITHDGRARTEREIDRDRVLAAGGAVQFGGEPPRQVATAWLP
jgi:signal transduction histidine kinase